MHRYGYPITCKSYTKDVAAAVTEVTAEYDPDYKGKKPPKVVSRQAGLLLMQR